MDRSFKVLKDYPNKDNSYFQWIEMFNVKTYRIADRNETKYKGYIKIKGFNTD